jgi:hypothetical protein
LLFDDETPSQEVKRIRHENQGSVVLKDSKRFDLCVSLIIQEAFLNFSNRYTKYLFNRTFNLDPSNLGIKIIECKLVEGTIETAIRRTIVTCYSVLEDNSTV